MQTDELSNLGIDFARRVNALDWPTDALLLAGMIPSTGPHAEPGQRTVREHVILIAPTREGDLPLPVLARSTRGHLDWIRVSAYLTDVMDMDLFFEALATAPPPHNDRDTVNLLVVHYTRRGEGEGSMRCFMAHHEEMDQRGGSDKLADDAWVHSTFRQWLDEG
jgi:hypothetical protein